MENSMKIPIQDEQFIDTIYKICRDYFGKEKKDTERVTRKREILQVRQIAMYFSKMYTKASLYTIGSKIGGKDHATVLHAYKTVENIYDTNFKFRTYINDIKLTIINKIVLQTMGILVCYKCGSNDIYVNKMVNIDPNFIRIVKVPIFNEYELCYCNNCQDESFLVTLNTYNQHKKEFEKIEIIDYDSGKIRKCNLEKKPD